jgi:hypothetical protein
VLYLSELMDMVKARFAVVLSGYLDESKQEDAGIFAIGGYLFDRRRAGKFEKQWRAALDSKNLTRFHMSEFDTRQGEFKGWPERERLPFQKRLMKIIQRQCLAEISVALDLRAYEALALPDRVLLGAYSPYTFCLRFCIEAVAEYVEHVMQSQESVQYILDQVGPSVGKGVLMNAFTLLLKRGDLRQPSIFRLGIPPMTWADSRQICHLQAADVWAYEAAKASATFLGRTGREPRKSLRMLMLPPERSVDHLIDADRLRILVETMRSGTA